jgi:glycerol-3-phosphate dehydrogenase (NAD(P)+)
MMAPDGEESKSVSTIQSAVQIAVFGAGAFGQALAAAAVQSGHLPTIYAPTKNDLAAAQANPALVSCRFVAMNENKNYWHEGNKQILPQLIVMAVPCQALRSAAGWLSQSLNLETTKLRLEIVIASKGVEQKTLLLPHQILEDVLGRDHSLAALSGPSFASEIVRGLPTSVVCASTHVDFVKKCARLLHRPNFRIYGSRDIIGVEVGGALKNVVAMVAGAADGLGLGNNGRAAVITRGLGEMTQVGVSLGADPLTFLGLSGLGDLVLTCTGDLSRNRTFGTRLASGERPADILKNLGEIVEGYATAQSAYELSRQHHLDTPIIDAVYGVLYQNVPIASAFEALGKREQKEEFEWVKN